MPGKRIGYVRVSSVDQNPERQLENIPLDKKFTDYASGKSLNRPELDKLIDYAREDDIIFVHSMDRLARNVRNLIDFVETMGGKGIQVHFIKENLIFNGKDTPLSKLLLTIIGAVAEFERALISERAKEGIALARKKGKLKGRTSKLNSELREKIQAALLTRKSKVEICREIGISRRSLYNYLPFLESA